MGRTIIKIKDYYLEYSSIVDAPITFGMTRKEFEQYYRDEYGRNGHLDFESRMRRVDKTGTSSYRELSPEDVIMCNRAGPNECELTIDEIFIAYCLRKNIRDGWTAT
jgi:hypothetical protein